MRDSTKLRVAILAATLAGTALATAAIGALGDRSAAATASPGAAARLAAALQVPVDAEVVFFEQCAPCHGTEGEGGIGPVLTGSTISVADRLQLIRAGRGAMPAFQYTLDEATIEALSMLVGRLAATTTYAQQCAPCHGAGGEGGIGPELVPTALSFDEARLVISGGNGAMPAFEPTLTADQIDEVTLFIEHLAQIQAGSDLYAELCAGCHGAGGEGGVGPALTGSEATPPEIIAAISQGAGAMPGFEARLDAPELEAVIAFTRRLVAGSAVAPPPAPGGAELYAEACAPCHGTGGEGAVGPPLTSLAEPDDDIATLVAEGRGGMPAFGLQLSADEIAGLVEFVRSAFGEPEATVSGEELYADHCAACHGAGGEGGAGPSLQALTATAEELTTLVGDGRGSMPGFASDLTADEVAAVVDFVETEFGGQEAPTTTAAVPQFSGAEMFADHCARCHGTDGSGDLGPDLRDTDLSLNVIISGIYGGHEGGMPAFEGELTGLEVQELARFVTTLTTGQEEQGAGVPWAWLGVVGTVVAAAAVAFVLWARRRRAS